jgi:hypothetical protein
MSYRNPQIIVDRSAEIYAQGAAKTGALFAQGVAGYFENKNKTAAAKKKKDDAYKLGLNGIALKADEALADATTTIQGSTLYGDIQDQARARLDGSDGQIGIIEKQAQLRLNPDLSPELSKQYRKDIADYQKWETNIVDKVSSTMADLEPIKDLTATTIGVPGKQDFIGEGNEKFKNFAVAYALDGKQVPGVESTRGVEGDLIKFNINIDPKNETIKKFIESGALNVDDLEATEDGKYQLNWERNLNNWDGGLIADVPDSMDIQSALEEGGLIKDGVITQEFTTGIDYDIKPIKNTGYQRVTEKIFFDPKLIKENPTVQAEFKKHAAGFLAPGSSLDEQMLGLRNNFNYAGSRQDWQDMTPEKQEEYIITELQEQAVEQAMQRGKDFKVQFDQKSGRYFTYGKTTERKIPDSTTTENKAAKKLKTTQEQLDSIKNFPMEINVEDVSVIGNKGTKDKFELINKLSQNMVKDISGKGLKLRQIEGGDVEFLLGSTSMGTASIEDMTSEDVKKFVYRIYGGSPKEIEGLSSEVLPQIQGAFSEYARDRK